MEAYRSGHNGPDSKSGSLHGLVGSNPTASAIEKSSNHAGFWIFLFCSRSKNHPIFSCSFRNFGKNSFLLLCPAFFCVLLPSAAEIARFGKRHTAHHRLRRGEFRTVIQMGVDIRRGGKIRMPQPVLNLLERYAVGKQERCAAMPLRYNKDKRKNPVFSRVSAFVVAYSIPFPTLIASRKICRMMGGVT